MPIPNGNSKKSTYPTSVGTERKGTTELPGGGDNSKENFPGEKKKRVGRGIPRDRACMSKGREVGLSESVE